MVENIYVIGDVHGKYKDMIRLISNIKEHHKKYYPNINFKDEMIYFVGDVIDRGEESVKVLNYLMNSKHRVVMGNHELMMVETLLHGDKSGAWVDSGGIVTMKEYKKDGKNLGKHLSWIQGLPAYIEIDIKDKCGRKLLVSHAPVINILNPDIKLNEMNINDFLWSRTIPKKNELNYFNIFGHNVVENFIRNKSGFIKVKKELLRDGILIDEEIGYACIDTGSGYVDGVLTAIEYPKMRVIR